MCGIVGMISRRSAGFNYSDMEMYEGMLLIDSLRGKDSTGVFTRFRNGDVRVIKHGSHPYNLFRTDEWKDFKNQVIQRGKFVIGHNRAATRGLVTTDNAHPFVEENIILVHNGTLREQENLTSEKTDVDSHAIAHALANDSYAEVLPQINGAFALVWYDTETDRLYATRNEERPLNLVVSNDILFLASEAWMAGIPASRNNIQVTANVEIQPGEIYVFTPDGKYTVEKFDLKAAKLDNSWDKRWSSHVKHNMMNRKNVDDMDDVPPFDVGTETPTIKALQQALIGTSTMTTSETSSVTCALTHTAGTGTRTSDEEQAEARMASIHKYNESFPRNLTVLVKIMTTSRMVNNRFSFTGIIHSPELERIDVRGFLPFEVQPAELGVWLDTICVASVQYTTSTIGGWTVHVKDVKKATYTQVNEKAVPIMMWDFAKNHCQCSTCNRKVEAWEKSFTGVKLGGLVNKGEKPINIIVMTCPDCIAAKIEKEEFRDRFKVKYQLAKDAITKARLAAATRTVAIQDGESVRAESAGKVRNVIALPTSATLQ